MTTKTKSTQDESVKLIRSMLSAIDNMRMSQTTKAVTTPEALLLKHGRAFPYNDKSFVGGGEKKACYSNAGTHAIVRGMPYVEGYITVHGVPITHAWNLDAEGNVYDSTIENGENIGGYYGIRFSRDYLTDTILDTKVWGLLDGMSNRRLYTEGLPDDAIE